MAAGRSPIGTIAAKTGFTARRYESCRRSSHREIRHLDRMLEIFPFTLWPATDVITGRVAVLARDEGGERRDESRSVLGRPHPR